MKKVLLLISTLILIAILAFAVGIALPNANAPNAVGESLPAEHAATGITVLAIIAVAADTGQLVRLVARIKNYILNKLHAIGEVAQKPLILQRWESIRPARGKPLEWGKTQIKPI